MESASSGAHAPAQRKPQLLQGLGLLNLVTAIAVCLAYLIWQSYTSLQLELGTWGCRMSWMSPNYIKMDGPRAEGMGGLENKYSLWLYREGGLQGHIKPEGLPVLFIPGNAGSSKQVRSIASSAAHKYYASKDRPDLAHLNWRELDMFTVDFNEEFSAFHAGSILEQAHYVAHSIRYILRQYGSAHTPEQVIVLGHSMGGIVARLALTLVQSGYDKPEDDISRMVAAIITMSTPHMLPPVTFDRGMDRIYRDIDRYWRTSSEISGLSRENTTLPVLVSICGGTADTQISSDACALPDYHSAGSSRDRGTFSVFTTGIEGIWTGVDHQAMVWCDQIRSKVATIALHMQATLSGSGGNASRVRDRLTTIARRELLAELPGQVVWPSPIKDVAAALNAQEIVPSNPSFRVKSDGSKDFIVQCPQGKACNIEIMGEYSIRGIGPEHRSPLEIYALVEGLTKSKFQPVPLAEVKVLPPSPPRSNFKDGVGAFPLQGEGVRHDQGLTYVQIRPFTNDTSHPTSLLLRMQGPGWGVIGLKGSENDNGWSPIRQVYNFDHVLDHSLIAHRVSFDRAKSKDCSSHFAPVAEHMSRPGLGLGETHESRYYPQVGAEILVHSHVTASPYIGSLRQSGLEIHLFQDPAQTCTITTASARVDWRRSPGLLLTRYRMTIIAWTLGVVCLVWSCQMRSTAKTGVYPAFSTTFAESLRLEWLLATCLLLACGVIQAVLSLSWDGIQYQNYLLGTTSVTLLFLIPCMMTLATGLVWLSHLCLFVMVALLSYVLPQRSKRSPVQPDDGLSKGGIVAFMALFALLWFMVPYQFALVVIFIIHLHSTAIAYHRGHHNELYSFLLILFWLLPLNAPTVLVWVRGLVLDWMQSFRFGSTWGTGQFIGIVVLAGVYASKGSPSVSRPKFFALNTITIGLISAYCAILGPRYTYGIHVGINLVAMLISLDIFLNSSSKVEGVVRRSIQ